MPRAATPGCRAPALQAKKDHGANAATLAQALQRLFTYGWQQRGGSGSSTPRRGTSTGSAAFAPAAQAAPAPAPGSHGAPLAPAGAGQPLPASPSKYRPPHARRSTQGGPAAEASGGGSLHLESSDSESSDAEGGGGGERYHASRVRSGALACLQLLAKADPKSLHGSWTLLLPTSDAVGCLAWGALLAWHGLRAAAAALPRAYAPPPTPALCA